MRTGHRIASCSQTFSRTIQDDAGGRAGFGPLGLLTAPPRRYEARACSQWLVDLIAAGVRVAVPEITDYELRRELLRAGKQTSIRRLDALIQVTEYLPITTAIMRSAADFWSQARRQGQPTAADNTIDVDVILAALALGVPDIVIATTNVGHLVRFLPAKRWARHLALKLIPATPPS